MCVRWVQIIINYHLVSSADTQFSILISRFSLLASQPSHTVGSRYKGTKISKNWVAAYPYREYVFRAIGGYFQFVNGLRSPYTRDQTGPLVNGLGKR